MSPICIAVVALKGGSGKTTTAINLLAGMASHRVEIEDGVYEHPVKYNRVLLIDTDQQSSLTMHITNHRCSSTDTTIYEVMTKKVAPMDAINKNQYPHIIPSEIDKMGGLDVALQKWPDAIYRLKKAVDEIKASGEYDVIVIDTPPNLSLATQAAICAADRVIITVQVDKYNIESESCGSDENHRGCRKRHVRIQEDSSFHDGTDSEQQHGYLAERHQHHHVQRRA